MPSQQEGYHSHGTIASMLLYANKIDKTTAPGCCMHFSAQASRHHALHQCACADVGSGWLYATHGTVAYQLASHRWADYYLFKYAISFSFTFDCAAGTPRQCAWLPSEHPLHTSTRQGCSRWLSIAVVCWCTWAHLKGGPLCPGDIGVEKACLAVH